VSFVVYLPCIPFEAVHLQNTLACVMLKAANSHMLTRQVRRIFSLKLTWMSVNNYFNVI
jgi:hypothetical protein